MAMKSYKQLTGQHVDPEVPAKPPAPPAGRAPAAETVERMVPTREGPVKSDRPAATAAARAAGGAVAKPSFEAGAALSAHEPAGFGYDDQQPKAGVGRRAEEGGRQYIRLHVRVHDGRLSIVDSHLVDGPLNQPTGFSGPNAYEVTMGGRLLHADSLPDLGVKRSFVNPEGPPAERGHYFGDVADVEFLARVPAHEVTAATIGDIAVRLHRVKEEARADRLGSAPLTVQFPRQIRQVAELVGLPETVLPEAIEARNGRTPRV